MKILSPVPEQQLRRRLGIPDDAQHVLIFTESSHWDPNWLRTSEEYYAGFVRSNLSEALKELEYNHRRIYSIECIFFLRLYWDRNPSEQEKIRDLVNSGRLRLTGSGVTTADTLLPDAEAILRDLLIGQEWLRRNGMEQEPNLAYFADSFGCTPTLPSLLNAAGFDRTSITRVDGMSFMGCDLESSRNFPRKGSSAERLLTRERSLDFIWRDRNDAQVLCHWNAFTYGQGDMLAYVGISRVYLARLAVSLRTERHIAHRIKKYMAQLSPCSLTPYMLCPIGFDFVEPIPHLVSLLDRYNQKYYPTTGIWTVNAGLDDYLSLIECHKEILPVLNLDPNPYWTGFYTARPMLKKRCRKLVDNLLLAEKLSFLPRNSGAERTISSDLDEAWWTAVVSNHHDFITGTSPDRVVEEEQGPWLDRAAEIADEFIAGMVSNLPETDKEAVDSESLSWTRENDRIRIKTSHYHIELDENAGGGIVNLQSRDRRIELLKGISNDLVSYRDSGGLWRMGLEFAGGIWKESMPASSQAVTMQVLGNGSDLELISTVVLDGETFRRRMWFSNNTPIIHCSVEGKAAEGHSITVRFLTDIDASKLSMDTPGGIVERPPKRIYDPTFWPLHHFAHLVDDQTGSGIAILQPMPGAISYRRDGQIELVAMRNATKEKVFGLIGIPGNPAGGHEREQYDYEFSLVFTESGDWQENCIHRMAGNVPSAIQHPRVDSIVTVDSPDVKVSAVKPASRGDGIIIRLTAPIRPKTGIVVSIAHLEVDGASLCDARERDLEPLEVQDGRVHLIMKGTVATIRLSIISQ